MDNYLYKINAAQAGCVSTVRICVSGTVTAQMLPTKLNVELVSKSLFSQVGSFTSSWVISRDEIYLTEL